MPALTETQRIAECIRQRRQTSPNLLAVHWAMIDTGRYLSQTAAAKLAADWRDNTLPMLDRSELERLAGLLVAEQTPEEIDRLATIDNNFAGLRKDAASVSHAIAKLSTDGLRYLIGLHPAQTLKLANQWQNVIDWGFATGRIKARALKMPRNFGIAKG